ncbi:MAG: hypothetical protein ACI4HI_12300 [Lachnospiraceae bacterium]
MESRRLQKREKLWSEEVFGVKICYTFLLDGKERQKKVKEKERREQYGRKDSSKNGNLR